MSKSAIASAAWIVGTVLLFGVQIVSGEAWPSGYSWSANNISDLGNVLCGQWDPDHPRYVCSPLHTAMNLSLMAYGVLLGVGVVLSGGLWRKGIVGWVPRALLLLVCAAWVLVGVYPSDVELNWHVLGAFVIGFLSDGLVIIGVSSYWQTVFTGAVIVLAVLLNSVQYKPKAKAVAKTA